MDAAAPQQILDEIERRGLEVEFLVNNAGFGNNGPFAELDPARQLGQVAVNITALVALTRGVLPRMLARRRGRILNVGSTAGFQPGPFMAVYYASKAFVNSFTEALWFELKGTGVTATVSCPGPTATEFVEVAGNADTKLGKMSVMSPSVVAGQAYRAMHAGKPMVVHGLLNVIGVWSAAFSPRGVVRTITASLNRPTPAK
jgi:short-subunit dehydrogenase